MWLVVDAMHRRREIPSMSLWIWYTFWRFILPVHYFRTRGRAGIAKFALHVGLVILVWVIGVTAYAFYP